MALYTGRFTLAECLAGMLHSDRSDGLWPTVVCNEHGVALGLAWSDRESLAAALDQRRGIYHSRARSLWVKGGSSGARQDLLAVALDCDRDTLRFTVRQHGSGFCHRGTRSCWGESSGLDALARRLAARRGDAPDGSYVGRLLADPGLLAAKLGEEAGELAAAGSRDEVIGEAADVMFFALVALARSGVTLAAVEQELDRRAMLVTRRPGNAKTAAPPSAGRAVAAAEDSGKARTLSGLAGGGS
jgi:phosphoribosyl-ATP pyrophosphohydrolase